MTHYEMQLWGMFVVGFGFAGLVMIVAIAMSHLLRRDKRKSKELIKP